MKAASASGSWSLLASFAALFGLLAVAGHASGTEVDACLANYERGQKLHLQNKLRASREALLACSQTTCPKAVTTECTGWLREVDASLPTIVVGARDAQGRDVPAGRLTIDGEVAATKLDGVALPIDPGAHRLRLEIDGAPALEKELVAREGEKNRHVEFAMPRSSPPAAAPASEVPVGPLVLGGAGLAAIGASIALGASALSSYHALESSCQGHCAPTDIDSVRTRAIASDVALGVGLGALAVSVVWAIARSPKRDAPKATLFVGPRGLVVGRTF